MLKLAAKVHNYYQIASKKPNYFAKILIFLDFYYHFAHPPSPLTNHNIHFSLFTFHFFIVPLHRFLKKAPVV